MSIAGNTLVLEKNLSRTKEDCVPPIRISGFVWICASVCIQVGMGTVGGSNTLSQRWRLCLSNLHEEGGHNVHNPSISATLTTVLLILRGKPDPVMGVVLHCSRRLWLRNISWKPRHFVGTYLFGPGFPNSEEEIWRCERQLNISESKKISAPKKAEQRFEPGLQGSVLALNWQVWVLKNRHLGFD